MDLRHAGVGWPANAGGEHPDRETIYRLPGVTQGALLICADSARFWYAEARARCPLVIWRAIPRQKKLPAQLGWDPNAVADECLNLWNEQKDNHQGVEWFLPLNELNFSKESGEDFPGYPRMAEHLGQVRLQLRRKFSQQYPGVTVKLMFPAWVPGDDGDRWSDWASEAAQWDGLCLHAYGDAETMRARYQAYRDAIGPTMPIFVGEWNANKSNADERAGLQMWAEIAANDPNFLGAAYYIWDTNNDGEHDFSIWGNDARLDLFLHPPVTTEDPGHANETGGSGDGTDTGTPAPDHVDDAMNPWQFWSAEQIAAAIPCTVQAVQDNWHRIVEQLDHCGLNDQPMQLAALGTIAAESQSFQPIEEYRNANGSIPSYWNDYDGGANYHGRGFIQITHAYNYRAYGEAVRQLWGAGADDPTFDLVAHPENALDPDIAAAVLACYFHDHAGGALVVAAHAGNWTEVRRLVNGGTGRLDVQNATIAALSGTPPVVVVPVFDSTVPIVPQNFDWDCAEQSLLWGMTAYGRHPLDSWMEGQMLAEHIESTELGLLDGGGAGLAAFVVEQYGEFGYSASALPTASYDDVIQVAGHSPVLIGGRHWGTAGHWSGVRGYDSQHDVLFLANPANGYGDVFQAMTRAQFNQVGPCAMVVITWGGAVAPPIQPAPPQPDEVAHLRTVLGYASHDVADALQQQVDAIVVSLDGLRAAINTLRQQGAA